MVNRMRRAIPLALAALLVASSCSLLTANPFPAYIAGIEKKTNIRDAIAGVLGNATSARYEISDITTPFGERVMILVSPLESQSATFSPVPKLLVFDASIDPVGAVTPQSPLGYVSRPFVLAADGNMLSGVTVFDPTTLTVVQTLNPNGLTGFGFSIGGTNTYVLSAPAGTVGTFTLNLTRYDNIWSAPTAYELQIVSAANVSGTGYSLEGSRLESDGDTITATVRNVDSDTLSVAKTSLSSIVGATAPPLLEGALAPATIDGAHAAVYYTNEGIVIRRSTGTLEHYTADGSRLTASIGCESVDGFIFGFSPDGGHMFRLDPVSGSFSLIRSWW